MPFTKCHSWAAVFWPNILLDDGQGKSSYRWTASCRMSWRPGCPGSGLCSEG